MREKKISRPSITSDTDIKGEEAAKTGGVESAQTNGVSQMEAHEEEILYEEDPIAEEGAVFPLENGRVVNWSCFLALLEHIYNTLSPGLHTPILIITQPCWTEDDHEFLTRFFFEKFKTPAFCLMDSALAVCYAYGVPTATVIDVGLGKCDVTAVSDFIIHDRARGAALLNCGGDGMTQQLLKLLSPKGFTKDMCEQLKKSSICEILPPNVTLPISAEVGDNVVNPASLASTGIGQSGPSQRGSIAAQGGISLDFADEDQDGDTKDGEDNDGVLDVASIVASGKTSEFLARKEREKAEKAAKKKAAADAAAKPTRLPNSQRAKATLHYDERRMPEEQSVNGKRPTESVAATNGAEIKRPRTPELIADGVDGGAISQKEERRRNRDTAMFIRKDVEVGPERFRAAEHGVLEHIADSIHRAILSVPEVGKRSELWESLIIVGNGSKVRGTTLWPFSIPWIPLTIAICTGFKDALLATIHSKYLISPSSATIFTSELPSNVSTPVATGANTPQPQQQVPGHHGPHVNPLLLAATTASNPTLAPPAQQHLQSQLQLQQQQQQQQHSSHGQSPTSIKVVKLPEYFSEWKEVGVEEATFLGAQVAAKVLFVIDQGLSKGFMSRTEYNELGPQGIHECCV